MAIAVTCTCGKKLRVADENAGRKIRCPACERVFRLPEADDERDEDERDEPTRRVRADRPAAKKPVSRRGRDDDDEEERDEPDVRARRRRPSKDRKRSALPLILGGVALLVLLGGGGFTGYWFLLRGSGMDESAFLPSDAQAFFTVRLADVVKLDGYQKAIRAQGGNDPLNQIAPTFGLAVADIERLTFVMQDFEQQAGWAVLTTSRPYDKKAVLGKFQSASTQKHEGKTYHTGQISTPGLAQPNPMMGGMGAAGRGGAATLQRSVFFAGPNVLVMADTDASMKRALAAAARKPAAGPLAEAMRQVGGPRHVAFGFALPPGVQEKMKGSMGMLDMLGPQLKPLGAVLQFTGGSGSADFGTNVLVELALKYADEGRAQAAMKSFTALKAMAEAWAATADPKTAEAMKAALAGLTAQQRGAELAVKLQVASQVLEGMVPAGGMPMR